MAHAYTPGLQVTKLTRVAKVRELPIPGKVLASVGDRVSATTPVLSADLPGDLDIIRVASRMDLDPQDVVSGVKVKVGDLVRKGDLVCEVKTFFGLFTIRLQSPISGEVEFFTEGNAHLGLRQPPIPLTVSAYIDGVVTEVEEGKAVVVETDASLIQGIFGVGGERLGKIIALPLDNETVVQARDLKRPSADLENTILVGGAQFDASALQAAAEAKVSAIVTGSIDAETLHQYVGYDIGVSITGDEDVPFTLIITEGFGCLPISERIAVLARDLEGRSASVNGATQVRAGAMRPEVIAPLPEGERSADAVISEPSQELSVGTLIRVIRVPYFGRLGTVTELPPQPTVIPSGAKVRVLKARLDSGEEVVVPRANVEPV